MEYKSVAILGAGAVGSYLIWGLSKKDMDVYVIASNERKDRFEKNGFYINDILYHPIIKTPKEAHGVDLLIVSVKYNALYDALNDIKEIVDEHTTIMSLMNGVDSEEIIGNVVGIDKIVYSLVKIASQRMDNKIYFNPELTIGLIYGEINNRKDRTDALNNLFSDSGIHYRVSDVILSEIWSKYRLNVSYNLPQAILNVGLGAFEDSEHVMFLSQKLREEVESVAYAKGIDLSLADDTFGKGTRGKKTARYSTLQDLDAKRHTEIDMFAGTMIKMGKELNIDVPYCTFAYHSIKVLEEKNDGKFEY